MPALTNTSTGKSEPIDPNDLKQTEAIAVRLASTTGMNPADVHADAELIAVSIWYGRTGMTDFADAMNALGLDLTH